MTGWAEWSDTELIDAGQTPLIEFLDDVDGMTGEGGRIGRLVIEEFRIYPWKCEDLAFDPVRTARGIGALEFIARHAALEVVFQSATIKEAAIAGGAETLFRRPLHECRHMNDAIMHGVYFAAMSSPSVKISVPGGGTVAALAQDESDPV